MRASYHIDRVHDESHAAFAAASEYAHRCLLDDSVAATQLTQPHSKSTKTVKLKRHNQLDNTLHIVEQLQLHHQRLLIQNYLLGHILHTRGSGEISVWAREGAPPPSVHVRLRLREQTRICMCIYIYIYMYIFIYVERERERERNRYVYVYIYIYIYIHIYIHTQLYVIIHMYAYM